MTRPELLICRPVTLSALSNLFIGSLGMSLRICRTKPFRKRIPIAGLEDFLVKTKISLGHQTITSGKVYVHADQHL